MFCQLLDVCLDSTVFIHGDCVDAVQCNCLYTSQFDVRTLSESSLSQRTCGHAVDTLFLCQGIDDVSAVQF